MSAVVLDRVSVEADGRRIVDGASLVVEHGEWVSLLGPNGAGKTTILRVVAGTRTFSGDAAVAGRSVAATGRRALARLVALVPQVPVVPQAMTVADYVLLGRTPHMGVLTRESSDDRRAAGVALRRLELEATAALDVGHQQQVLELVDELRRTRGLTVLAALHDLTLAGQYGDRVALVDRGAVIAEGAASAVLTSDRLRDLFGARVRVVDAGGTTAVVPVRP